jgi:putative endonuclease
MNTNWWVYLLECSDSTLYCGITTDYTRREWEHNNSNKGSKYTRSRRPVKLVWKKLCKNRSDSSKLEYKIKKMSRSQKLKLIS